MSAERIIITGPSGLAARLEINDFVKNEMFFTLFIMAFRTFFALTTPHASVRNTQMELWRILYPQLCVVPHLAQATFVAPGGK